MTYKLSIVIPMYNASKYIERCARSLFRQTLDNIQFIFVDDCSTDDTVKVLREIINDYPDLTSNIVVLLHGFNMGSASTRNTGLKHSSAQFVGWCDSDDSVEENMYADLYNKAISSQSELAWCNFKKLDTQGNSTELKQIIEENPSIFAKALLLNKTQGSICNKIIKRDLFVNNSIKFFDGNDLGEDFNVVFKVLYYCKKIVYVDKALYNYFDNNVDSLTKGINSIRIRQALNNAEDIVKFIKDKNIKIYRDDEIERFKFLSKKKLLFSDKFDDFKLWVSVFPESNYMYSEGLLNSRHEYLAKQAVKGHWSVIRIWIVIKKLNNFLKR